MPYDPLFYIVAITALLTVLMGAFFLNRWTLERRDARLVQQRELELRHELEKRRFEAQAEQYEKRLQDAQARRYEDRESAKEAAASRSAGPGTGGYIVVSMPDAHRPMFHDLLKGFEEYAMLKGYSVAFSIDATFTDRIAFKFTQKADGFAVGTERVRKDFKEYLARVRSNDVDSLDELPVITSIEEHELIVTMLKNRLVMIQNNYTISENSRKYYEYLLTSVQNFPALPHQPIVVQTGGYLDSRSYVATNSQRLLQGSGNSVEDGSVNVGVTLAERLERVTAIDELLESMSRGQQGVAELKAQKGLENARDEMTESKEPDQSAVLRWLTYAKDGLKTAALAADTSTAAQKLFGLFGLPF